MQDVTEQVNEHNRRKTGLQRRKDKLGLGIVYEKKAGDYKHQAMNLGPGDHTLGKKNSDFLNVLLFLRHVIIDLLDPFIGQLLDPLQSPIHLILGDIPILFSHLQ